jgi:hypothetical protein
MSISILICALRGHRWKEKRNFENSFKVLGQKLPGLVVMPSFDYMVLVDVGVWYRECERCGLYGAVGLASRARS